MSLDSGCSGCTSVLYAESATLSLHLSLSMAELGLE